MRTQNLLFENYFVWTQNLHFETSFAWMHNLFSLTRSAWTQNRINETCFTYTQNLLGVNGKHKTCILQAQNLLLTNTKSAILFLINISTVSELLCDRVWVDLHSMRLHATAVLCWPHLEEIQVCSLIRNCKTGHVTNFFFVRFCCLINLSTSTEAPYNVDLRPILDE